MTRDQFSRRSFLQDIGADTDKAPNEINLDVSGTIGPDHLGQETTDVPGHWADRPGVRSRIPEEHGKSHPEVGKMDTGSELPVLLSSEMRADPCEGVQGTYTTIEEGHCARCGYDRIRRSVHTLAGETKETCMACGAVLDGREENGYRMPKTVEDRTERRREAGPTLGSLTSLDVVDLEPDTGFGPMVSLVGQRKVTSLYKDDVADLFWLLVENDDIDLVESVNDELDGLERLTFLFNFLESLGIEPSELVG
jgi:hypothetical protein